MDAYTSYIKSVEGRSSVCNKFIHSQPELVVAHLPILYDWFAELLSRTHGHRSDLSIPVLLKTIEITNRFLAEKQVARNMLQLVGTTALWISCKLHSDISEEMLLTHHLAHYCEYAYIETDFRRMEMIMLKSLQYKVTSPTSLSFYHAMIESDPSEISCPEVDVIARYLITRAAFEYDMLLFSPSQIAASCLYVAQLEYGSDLAADKSLLPCIRCIDKLSITLLPEDNAIRRLFSFEDRACIQHL